MLLHSFLIFVIYRRIAYQFTLCQQMPNSPALSSPKSKGELCSELKMQTCNLVFSTYACSRFVISSDNNPRDLICLSSSCVRDIVVHEIIREQPPVPRFPSAAGLHLLPPTLSALYPRSSPPRIWNAFASQACRLQINWFIRRGSTASERETA